MAPAQRIMPVLVRARMSVTTSPETASNWVRQGEHGITSRPHITTDDALPEPRQNRRSVRVGVFMGVADRVVESVAHDRPVPEAQVATPAFRSPSAAGTAPPAPRATHCHTASNRRVGDRGSPRRGP